MPAASCWTPSLPRAIGAFAEITGSRGGTRLLERATGEARKLAEVDQDAIAALILDERRRDGTFARSQGQLTRLAAKVCRDIADDSGRNIAIDEL